MRFSWFEAEAAAREAGPDVYRSLTRVRGPWTRTPAFAVYAEWELADPDLAARFEQSRRDLFALRARHIESFYADWLLRRVDGPPRYVILGLYGTVEGLDAARGHPEIRAFATAHPADEFGARDLHGIRTFDVADATDLA